MSESKPKIMAVDDEPELLLTITEILEDAGYEVFGVEDGYKAIELASQEAFALVMMDIRLQRAEPRGRFLEGVHRRVPSGRPPSWVGVGSARFSTYRVCTDRNRDQ